MPASLVVGAIAFVVIGLASQFHPTSQNNFVYMAQAFLHGRADIEPPPGEWIDAIVYRGRYEFVEAPLPGVLLMPFVFVWHANTNQTVLAVALGAIAIGAAWLLCERLGTTFVQRLALVGFLAFGTSLFWCAVRGDVWFLAHASAVAFTMLALAELAGRRRGWLVALFAGAAGLSRFPFFLALPFYFAVERSHDRGFWNGRRGFVTIAVVALAAWVWDNEARWGTLADIGLGVLYHQVYQLYDRLPTPFHLGNLHRQLLAYFTVPPKFYDRPPWIAIPIFGMSIQWTSPALIAAFWARAPRHVVAALWILAIAMAVPTFLYFDTGDVQFGMRHALDFEPFLFVLMIFAVRNRRGVFLWPLFVYSIAFGIWGVWSWQTGSPVTS